MSYLKNPHFLLIIIVLAFLSREIFLAGVFPLFTGQDEARHYNTIQWLSQKQEPHCTERDADKTVQDKNNLATYRFSEEIRETSAAAGLSVWREENYRKPAYIPGHKGPNESSIEGSAWVKDTLLCPPDIVPPTIAFFHRTASWVESAWAETSIFTRFYLVRSLAVFFGALTIVFAYLAATEAGFSRRAGLLIALIISLQPRLSIYTTNINYDTLLIACFALFVWAGLRCLRRGFTPSHTALLALALGSAVLTKGTGLVLLAGVLFLGGWAFTKKRAVWKQVPLHYWIMGAILIGLVGWIISNAYTFSSLLPHFSLSSFWDYLGKSLPRIPSSSENFWGIISWNESNLGIWFVYAIWLIEALAVAGLIRFFYTKENLSFLPSQSSLLFCLTLLLSLQLGVRFHDWHVFQETGKLLLGTPGRYFLPTLLPQLILVAAGLGTLLRKKLLLERSLIALALIMLAFNLYTIWFIIIPRFYL